MSLGPLGLEFPSLRLVLNLTGLELGLDLRSYWLDPNGLVLSSLLDGGQLESITPPRIELLFKSTT